MNKRIFSLFALSLVLVILAGCASHTGSPPQTTDQAAIDQETEYENPEDPYEGFNRAMFEFNRGLDKVLLKPVASAYLELPEDGRKSVNNLIDNYKSPVSLANAVLQGERERSGNIIGRFFINMVIGIGGLFDPATFLGIEDIDEDFGQTLAVWGVESGPYLVLPILGPSNPRDFFGRGVDVFFDPLTYVFNGQNYGIQASMIRGGVTGINQRANVMEILDDIEANSLDFYATIRSLSQQRRRNAIRNGVLGDNELGPSNLSYETPQPQNMQDTSAGEMDIDQKNAYIN